MADIQMPDLNVSGSNSHIQNGQPNGLSLEELKRRMQDCIDSVEYHGSSAMSAVYSSYTNPGLHIASYGSVGLPLSSRDMEGIVKFFAESPSYENSRTCIFNFSDNGWEVNAAGFECRNPTWHPFVQDLTEEVALQLGVSQDISAEPSKLLLHGKGASFQKHQLGKAPPGTFGTLVICLPSEHSGGEVRTPGLEPPIMVETAPDSAFDLSTLAWYMDLETEFKPVTSGHRLAIVYHLVRNPVQERPTAAAQIARRQELSHLLAEWDTCFADVEKLLYVLDRNDQHEPLTLRNLKGRDAQKGEFVDSLCSQSGFYWALGCLKYEDFGWVHEEFSDYSDEYSDELVLETTLPYAGTGNRCSMFRRQIQESEMLDPAALSEQDADNCDRDSFIVIVLFRKEAVLNRLESMRPDHLEQLFIHILADHQNCPNERSTNMLAATRKTILDIMLRSILYSGESLHWTHRAGGIHAPTIIARGKASNKDIRLARSAVEGLYEDTDFRVVHEALRGALTSGNWQCSHTLHALVASHIARWSMARTEDESPAWSNLFDSPLGHDNVTYSYVDDVTKALWQVARNIQPFPVTGLPPSPFETRLESIHYEFVKWIPYLVETFLLVVEKYQEEDIDALVQLMISFERDTFAGLILPALKNCRHIPHKLRFLSSLSKFIPQSTTVCEAVVKPIYQAVIGCEKCRSNFQLFEHSAASKYSWWGSRTGRETWMEKDGSPTREASDYVVVLEQTVKLGLPNETARLLQQGLIELSETENTTLSKQLNVFDIVDRVAPALQHTEDETVRKIARTYITGAASRAVESLMPRRPIRPNGWSRATTHRCEEPACQRLRRWLANPTSPVEHFEYHIATRKHLQKSLNADYYKFETVKTTWPHTLVIYKTDYEYGRTSMKWRDDARIIQERLQKCLSDPAIASLLGDDVRVLEDLERRVVEGDGKIGSDIRGGSPLVLGPMSNRPRNPGAVPPVVESGETEVIDLTELEC